jgi:hypothetical protein
MYVPKKLYPTYWKLLDNHSRQVVTHIMEAYLGEATMQVEINRLEATEIFQYFTFIKLYLCTTSTLVGGGWSQLLE